MGKIKKYLSIFFMIIIISLSAFFITQAGNEDNKKVTIKEVIISKNKLAKNPNGILYIKAIDKIILKIKANPKIGKKILKKVDKIFSTLNKKKTLTQKDKVILDIIIYLEKKINLILLNNHTLNQAGSKITEKNLRIIAIQNIENEDISLKITNIDETKVLLEGKDNFKMIEQGLFLYDVNKLQKSINKYNIKDDDLLLITAENVKPYNNLKTIFSYSDIKDTEEALNINTLTSFIYDYLDDSNALTKDTITEPLNEIFIGYGYPDTNQDNLVDYRDVFSFNVNNDYMRYEIYNNYKMARLYNTDIKIAIDTTIQEMPNNINQTPFELVSNNKSTAKIQFKEDYYYEDVILLITQYYKNNISSKTKEFFIKPKDFILLNNDSFIEYWTCWTEDIDDCSNLKRLYYHGGRVQIEPKHYNEDETSKKISSGINQIKIKKLDENQDFRQKLIDIMYSNNEKIIIKYKVCQLYHQNNVTCEL